MAAAQAGLFIAFLAGRGTWDGAAFHMEALKTQFMVQVPLALIQLFLLLAWIREDDSPR